LREIWPLFGLFYFSGFGLFNFFGPNNPVLEGLLTKLHEKAALFFVGLGIGGFAFSVFILCICRRELRKSGISGNP